MQTEWRKNGERLPANPHAAWIARLLRVVGRQQTRRRESFSFATGQTGTDRLK